jgi:hypothetical protein
MVFLFLVSVLFVGWATLLAAALFAGFMPTGLLLYVFVFKGEDFFFGRRQAADIRTSACCNAIARGDSRRRRRGRRMCYPAKAR